MLFLYVSKQRKKTTVMKKEIIRLLHASARRFGRGEARHRHENKNRCEAWRSLCSDRRSSFRLSSFNIRSSIYFCLTQYIQANSKHSRKYFPTIHSVLCCCRPDSVGTTQNPTVGEKENRKAEKQKMKKKIKCSNVALYTHNLYTYSVYISP